MGRTNANLYTGQGGIFNRMDRPLNHYGLTPAVVTCPRDQGRADTQPHTLFEWVGNSYMFNAVGYPSGAGERMDRRPLAFAFLRGLLFSLTTWWFFQENPDRLAQKSTRRVT